MNAPSLKDDERARKNLAAVLSGLSRVGQVNVARALDVSEATVSRMKDADLPAAARVISICGLKIVPAEYRCLKPEVATMLLELAGQQMDRLRRDPEGLYEDPE